MTYHCEAVLFDLDGTLVDSTVACEDILRKWAIGHELDAEHIVRAAHGRRNLDVVRTFAPHLPAEQEAAWLDEQDLHYRDGIVAVRGAADVLAALPRANWAIVTSASKPVARLRLECTGLPEPAVLITADQVPRGKPAPDGYLAAAARLGARPERCLVIEDTLPGFEAGWNAGMQVLGITTTFSAAELNGARCISDFTCLRIERGAEPGMLTVKLTKASQ